MALLAYTSGFWDSWAGRGGVGTRWESMGKIWRIVGNGRRGVGPRGSDIAGVASKAEGVEVSGGGAVTMARVGRSFPVLGEGPNTGTPNDAEGGADGVGGTCKELWDEDKGLKMVDLGATRSLPF